MKKYTFWLLFLLCPIQSIVAQEQNDYLKWMQTSLPNMPEWTSWQQEPGNYLETRGTGTRTMNVEVNGRPPENFKTRCMIISG